MIFSTLSCILILITFALSLQEILTDDSSALVGKSFATRSSVSVVLKNGGSYVSHIHEAYSAEQKRAKLDYRLVKSTKNKVLKDIKPEEGSITYELQTNTLLLFDATSLDCKETSLEEIAKLFRLEVPDTESDLVADDYIIGPARLLFFIDKNAHKMKLETLEESLAVRNIPAQAYTFEYDTKYDKIKFKVLYSTDSLAANSKTTPLSIIMVYEGGKKGEDEQVALVVEYFKFEMIKSYVVGINSVQTWYDPFIIEPATSCSQALADKAINMFGDKRQDDVRFSFRAHFEAAKFPFSAYVSYDARSDIMRYDLIDSSGTTGVRKQLFNLHQNKIYHVMEKVQNSATPMDRILDLSLGSDSHTSQCVTANILRTEPIQGIKPISLAKLLVGSERFVYMGLARVRGIDVKVYETHVGGLPFWLEQPIVFRRTNSSKLEIRDPGRGLIKSDMNIEYTVLLYLAERDKNHPLIMIDIYKMDSIKLITWSKQTIMINDFVWDLDFRTAHGDDMEQLFSLQDVCSSNSNDQNYAKIKLLLESEDTDSETALSKSDIVNSKVRYLSLLAAIQETFSLPAQMIYDLESKMLKQHKNSIIQGGDNKKFTKLLLSATFRISEQVEDKAELIYLGQGNYNRLYKGQPVNNVARSFQACFLAAAHRKENIYFGYNPATKRCIIILEPIEGDADSKKLDCFVLKNSKEEMEVYRINYVKDDLTNHWIKNMFYSTNKLKYLGRRLKLEDLTSDIDGLHSIDFVIKTFEVDESDYKTSISTGDKAEKNELQVKTNKIDGYGLISGEFDSKRVSPAPLNSYSWRPLSGDLGDNISTMTLQQCEAACAADLDCKSYSICLKDYELECVISSTSFSSPVVIKQIEENGKIAKWGDRISVIKNDIDHSKTNIIKNPTCELYNMIFMDLFKKKTSFTIQSTFTNRRIYPVKDLEECARLCVKDNLLLWRNDVAQTVKSLLGFNPTIKSLDKSDFLETYTEHLRVISGLINKSILYLERTAMQSLPKNLIAKIENRILDEDKIPGYPNSVEGYCIIGEKLNPNERKILESKDKFNPQDIKDFIPLDMYFFKFNLFYEKQYGVKLLASHMSDEQFEAYGRAFRQKEVKIDKDYSILKRMIELGDNFQETLYFNELECARICFTQVWGPWPACRSFDVIVELSRDEYVAKCSMNSITLRQAISTNRLDLIDDSPMTNTKPDDVLQVYHFEPRPGLALDESNLNANLKKIEAGSIEEKGPRKQGYRIGSFGTFGVVLLALTGGIFIGIKLGLRIKKKIDDGSGGSLSMFHRDRDSLVRRTSKIEFNNIVNDEGVIR